MRYPEIPPWAADPRNLYRATCWTSYRGHNKRKLRQALAHFTSPGFVNGRGRGDLALCGEGPSRLITDRAVIGFDPDTHEATLVSLHPVVRLEEVLENTGFRLHVPKNLPSTPLPNSEEIRLLREEIDPNNMYLGASL